MNKAQAEDLIYRTACQAAINAANEAGDKWMAAATARGPAYAVMNGNTCIDTMLDVCGIVYIQLNDKRSKFVKWATKNGYSYGGYSLRLPYKYSNRQEMGLQEACCDAAINYLHSVGITNVRLYSHID